MTAQSPFENSDDDDQPLAECYEECNWPIYFYGERYTILSVLPDVQGKKVLDIGCGTGGYAREFQSRGAALVKGVDLSKTRLDIARSKEKKKGSVIQYIQADFMDWWPDGQYDLVFSSYHLLNYAKSIKQLNLILEKLHVCMASDGNLVLVIGVMGKQQASNYEDVLSWFKLYHKSPLKSFERYRVTFKAKPCSFDLYPACIDPADVLDRLSKKGFADIRLHPLQFSPDACQHLSTKEVSLLTIHPFCLTITARRL